jgi:hypothetical protein
MKNNTNTVANFALAGGAFGLFIDWFKQSTEIDRDPTQDFDFSRLFKTGLKGLVIGCGVGVVYSGIRSAFESENLDEEDFEEVEYLEDVLKSYLPDSIDKETIKKGLSIKKKIYDKFDNLILGRPKFQGSMSQGTALSGISDLDILVQFKKTSFQTLREMYFFTLDFFQNQFYDPELCEIREQRHSIGLLYEIDGEQVWIDVVPARRIDFNQGGNDYNLYENQMGLFGKPSRIKINPYKQAEFGSEEQAKTAIVTLIKVLKTSEDLPLKSVLIKELTKKAFDSIPSNKQLTNSENLLYSLIYIRDNIESKRIFSPDNSNNVLSEMLTKNEKRKVADSLDYIIEDITDDPRRMKKYFPHKEHL